jgi:glycosyltransferase involved in cell wall biosynthesis
MENILALSYKLLEVLQDFSFELIFVDDGSTDGTIRNIKAIANSRIILVELNKRFGQSIALAHGIEIARGKYIVTMDGDLQNDPKDIPKLLELIQTNQWDLITGIRMKRKDSILRTIRCQCYSEIFDTAKGQRLGLWPKNFYCPTGQIASVLR